MHVTSGVSNDFDTSMCDDDDGIEEMLHVVEDELWDCPALYESLKSDAEKPLYFGCTKYTRLLAVLKLYNLKARYGWSDSSFTALLAFLRDILPKENELPTKM